MSSNENNQPPAQQSTSSTENMDAKPTKAPNPARHRMAESSVSSNDFASFLSFQTFATPVLVQIAFWIGVVVCLFIGGGIIESADRGRYGVNAELMWTGVFTILLGPLLLRIAAELVLVVFRIYEQLQQLNKRAAREPSARANSR